MVPTSLQCLEGRLTEATAAMVDGGFPHSIDLELCSNLIEAAAHCVQRPVVTNLLTTAAAYVQGHSAGPCTLEIGFEPLVQLLVSSGRKEVRIATANLVALLAAT